MARDKTKSGRPSNRAERRAGGKFQVLPGSGKGPGPTTFAPAAKEKPGEGEFQVRAGGKGQGPGPTTFGPKKG